MARPRIHARVTAIALGAAALGAAALGATDARAALTDSERSEIRARWEKGDVREAARLRALLARPDLDASEAGAALGEAARGARFDARRLAFVRALLFGPATLASRSELVPPVVDALLTRAGAVMSSEGGAVVERADEIARVHRFVATEIAGAGDPKRDTGVRADARRAALAVYRARVALPAAMRATLDPALAAAQTQADLAMLALGDGLVAPGDLAGALGLDGAARALLERTGVLCAGLERASAARGAEAVRLVESIPVATRGAALLWIGKGWPRRLAAGGATIVASTPLGATGRVPGERRWPATVAPSSPDAALAEIAFVLGRTGAARLGRLVPAFEAAAARAAERARAGGADAALGVAALAGSLAPAGDAGGPAVDPSTLVGRAVELVAMDAPRALDLALARAAAGERAPMASFALALAVLASDEGGALRDRAEVGVTEPDGTRAPIAVTGIAGAPARIERFTIDGHAIALAWSADGSRASVTRDGRAPALSMLATARVTTTAADAWTPPAGASPSRVTRLVGAPEVGFDDAGRVVVRAARDGKARDAVAVVAPDRDLAASLRLRCLGAPCSVVARATGGAAGPAGFAITIEPGRDPSASLVWLDGVGNALPLGEPVALGAAGPEGHAVRLVVRGTDVEATIGDRRLAAALPASQAGGPAAVAIAPGAGGEAEVRGLAVTGAPAAAPAKGPGPARRARR